MDMLELIGMIDEMRGGVLLFKITLEELPPFRTWVATREDEYYLPKKLHSSMDVKCFYNKEDTIAFLSDKELFGWQVKGYTYETSWNDYPQMTIELYRRDYN